jgi:hypothetical protein
MFNLINESDKINVSLNGYSGSEEHFSTAEERLAEQRTSDGEPSTFLEPPVEFDSEAQAAYKVWQESLAYLQEDLEGMI